MKKGLNKKIITTKESRIKGYSKKEFYDFIKENEYEKISHGIYASKDTFVDPLLVLKMRCPRAVASHDEALYYFELTDREPLKPTCTINSGYNASKLKKAGYKIYYVNNNLLDIGKTKVIDNFGNEIYMYNLERTICDLIRNRNNFEVIEISNALKKYLKRKDKNIDLLFKYAKVFSIDKIIFNYLSILM